MLRTCIQGTAALGLFILCTLSLTADAQSSVPKALVTWVGTTDGNWADGANWSTGSPPGPTDDVTIDVAQDIIVTISANVTVRNMTCNEDLDITNATLTVTGAATVGGILNITGATVVANGSLASFTHSGPVNLTGAKFSALAGGEIVTSATNYATSGPVQGTVFYADGDNSRIDLSQLTTLTLNIDNGFTAQTALIHALNSGEIDFSGLQTLHIQGQQVDTLRFLIESNGAIDFSGLQQITGTATVEFRTFIATFTLPSLSTAQFTRFVPQTASTITANGLTTLNGGAIVIGAGGTLNVASLVSVLDADVDLTSTAQLNTANWSTVDGSRFFVRDGAQLTNITDTNYTGGPMNGTLVVVDGAGSLLDLSSFQSINQNISNGNGAQTTLIHTLNSAVLNLSGLQTLTLTGQRVDTLRFRIESGSTVNLASLNQIVGTGSTEFSTAIPSFTLPNLVSAQHTRLVPDAGSAIAANVLSLLDGGGITIVANAAVSATALTSFLDADLNMTGNAVLNTANWSDIDHSRFFLQGGATFGNVSDANYVGGPINDTLWRTEGGGSFLDLSALESIEQDVSAGNGAQTTTIEAVNSGQIDLSGLQTLHVPGQEVDTLRVRLDTGGQIDMTSLEEITGTAATEFSTDVPLFTLPALLTAQVARFVPETGSTITANALTQMTNGAIILVSGSTLNVTSLTTFLDATLDLSGTGLLNTANWSNVDGSRFFIRDGAQFAKVSDQNYVGDPINGDVFFADGTGSLLDLSAIHTITHTVGRTIGTDTTLYRATNGGYIDLSGVLTLNVTGQAVDTLLISAATGGIVDLALLSAISGTAVTHFTAEDLASFIDLSSLQFIDELFVLFTEGPGAEILLLDSDNDGTDDITEGSGDPDNDGLPNYLDPDSDNDGIPDVLEYEAGLNPVDSADAERDTDGDGLPNVDELVNYLTKVRNPDSDGDGMHDGFEVLYGFDPLDPADGPQDEDGDTYTNAVEFRQRSNPINVNSPRRAYFADPAAQAAKGTGAPDSPFATVAEAMAAAQAYTSGPVIVVLKPGVYDENIALIEGVVLAGSIDGGAVLNGAGPIAVQGAANAEIRGLTLRQDAADPGPTVLLDLTSPMRVAKVDFVGNGALGSTAIRTGEAATGVVIERCTIVSLASGLEILGPLPTLRQTLFDDLALHAVALRESGAKGATGGSLGDSAGVISGYNTFGETGDAVIRNERTDTLLVENNDWGTDDSGVIAASVSGNVDFEPFLKAGTAADVATLAVILINAGSQAPVADGAVELDPINVFGLEQDFGLFLFPVLPTGTYTATSTAPGYEEDSRAASLLSGDVRQLIVPMDPLTIPADSDGDGLSDSDELNIYGTNRFSADTDNDGINDDVEIAFGTNPLEPDSEPIGPTAGFSYTQAIGPAPLEVAFTDQSVPGTAFIEAYLWDFGDGATSFEQHPVHTYTQPGTYSVTLSVTTAVDTDVAVLTNIITATLDTGTGTGDFSGDGNTDAVDLQLLILAVLDGNSPTSFDLNDDGQVNAVDIQLLILLILGIVQ